MSDEPSGPDHNRRDSSRENERRRRDDAAYLVVAVASGEIDDVASIAASISVMTSHNVD